jgi:hypothetical protein
VKTADRQKILVVVCTTIISFPACSGRRYLAIMPGANLDADIMPDHAANDSFMLADDGLTVREDAQPLPDDAAHSPLDWPGADLPPSMDTGVSPDTLPPNDVVAREALLADATDSAREVAGEASASEGGLRLDAGDGGLAPLAGLRIALVGNPNPTPEDSLLAWLEQSTGLPVPRILTDATVLTATMLSSYDLLILECLSRSYSASEATILASWVADGGAIMTVTGFVSSSTDPTNTNSLLSAFGIAYGTYLTGGTGNPARTSDLADHPIMTGIQNLPFWGGFTVLANTGPDGGDGNTTASNTTLAMSQAQPVGVAQVRGSGRALV